MRKYAELLKDPRWQRTRLKVLERDKWRCLRCREWELTLHVHHTFYASGRAPWEYHMGSLITLCERCHEGISTGAIIDSHDGIRTQAESDAMWVALMAWRDANTAKDDAARDRAYEAMTAARTLTWARVRARPEAA